MKANEAPERIYIDDFGSELSHDWHTEHSYEKDIEYIRKNAFIEKAVKFLKEWNAYRVCLEGHKDWFIEKFKNYMKGE